MMAAGTSSGGISSIYCKKCGWVNVVTGTAHACATVTAKLDSLLTGIPADLARQIREAVNVHDGRIVRAAIDAERSGSGGCLRCGCPSIGMHYKYCAAASEAEAEKVREAIRLLDIVATNRDPSARNEAFDAARDILAKLGESHE